MSTDYSPQSDGAFLERSKTLAAYVDAHAAAFKVDEGVLANVQTLLTAYQTAYTKAAVPNRGEVGVLAKNEARDALKPAVRTFVKAYLTFNPAVSDTDKESMGLPARQHPHTHAAVHHPRNRTGQLNYPENNCSLP
jgi:hypothetical protein